MSMNEQVPMKRKYAVAVILAVACVVAYGFSKGWFSSASPSPEMEGTKVSASQPLDQEGASKEVAPTAEVTKEPANSAAK